MYKQKHLGHKKKYRGGGREVVVSDKILDLINANREISSIAQDTRQHKDLIAKINDLYEYMGDEDRYIVNIIGAENVLDGISDRNSDQYSTIKSGLVNSLSEYLLKNYDIEKLQDVRTEWANNYKSKRQLVDADNSLENEKRKHEWIESRTKKTTQVIQEGFSELWDLKKELTDISNEKNNLNKERFELLIREANIKKSVQKQFDDRQAANERKYLDQIAAEQAKQAKLATAIEQAERTCLDRIAEEQAKIASAVAQTEREFTTRCATEQAEHSAKVAAEQADQARRAAKVAAEQATLVRNAELALAKCQDEHLRLLRVENNGEPRQNDGCVIL